MTATGDFVPAFVRLIVKMEQSDLISDRKFPVTTTVRGLKQKVELLTGASMDSMSLELRRPDDSVVCRLTDDDACLESYPVTDGLTLHVSDPEFNGDEFRDYTKVVKMTLSEEQYNERNDSLRKFKRELGYAAECSRRREKEEQERKEREKVAEIKVGLRCQVRGVGGQPPRRGTVAYVGEVDFKPGIWVGVKYDLALGKNDGSVHGKRYFECRPKHGGFVRAADVTVGDFPPEDEADGDVDTDEEL